MMCRNASEFISRKGGRTTRAARRNREYEAGLMANRIDGCRANSTSLASFPHLMRAANSELA